MSIAVENTRLKDMLKLCIAELQALNARRVPTQAQNLLTELTAEPKQPLAELDQAETCRRLHDMVNEIAEMPDELFRFGYPLIRITYERRINETYVLVAGIQVEGNSE